MRWFDIEGQNRFAVNTYTAKSELPISQDKVILTGNLPLLCGHVLYSWNNGEYLLVMEDSVATDTAIEVKVKREAFLYRKWDASLKRWRNRLGRFCKKHLAHIPAGSQITLWGSALIEGR